MIIEGYASKFFERDLNDDVVVPWAFKASLTRTGAEGVKMLYQHGSATPVGVWDEVSEDATGLFVRGRVFDLTPEARLVQSLIRAGALDGLSIGFRTLKSRPDETRRLRVLTEVELWEVSFVTFPMLPSARLLRVREAA
ncbi:HK97 family phage prohead protease [Asticcacaulis sp. ZE23SCel15]|uniref:HK97 family phage prohead protease n=1 Tax=Asticcacaulis sp. ZE23SCel15 TaxID=3059027 RepID=UPI00265DBA62|nr:HK97 family phage prohead protease [Asticcacaulis sp. ZE23SCel15]WKL57722.1 HK97 family phage prohead protease [Asticcacaulis sp. ZE23SCel15]